MQSNSLLEDRNVKPPEASICPFYVYTMTGVELMTIEVFLRVGTGGSARSLPAAPTFHFGEVVSAVGCHLCETFVSTTLPSKNPAQTLVAEMGSASYCNVPSALRCTCVNEAPDHGGLTRRQVQTMHGSCKRRPETEVRLNCEITHLDPSQPCRSSRSSRCFEVPHSASHHQLYHPFPRRDTLVRIYIAEEAVWQGYIRKRVVRQR